MIPAVAELDHILIMHGVDFFPDWFSQLVDLGAKGRFGVTGDAPTRGRLEAIDFDASSGRPAEWARDGMRHVVS